MSISLPDPASLVAAHAAPRLPAGQPDPIPDPICPKTCRRCHYCLRLLHGADYWARGVAK